MRRLFQFAAAISAIGLLASPVWAQSVCQVSGSFTIGGDGLQAVPAAAALPLSASGTLSGDACTESSFSFQNGELGVGSSCLTTTVTATFKAGSRTFDLAGGSVGPAPVGVLVDSATPSAGIFVFEFATGADPAGCAPGVGIKSGDFTGAVSWLQ